MPENVACNPLTSCEAPPLVLSPEIQCPLPVAVRTKVIPKPYLPYTYRTRKGYPVW